ncbi:MAG TPA: twin-arginine translocase subunit TatC [Streptosporangiaceae bacterium]|jgi:sec-independent protein translocase protein TatC|nr:twin-arginine translocase subunit TatC [Streptosporangiaceae bacterium]
MAKLPEAVAGARVAGSRVLQASRKADAGGRMPIVGHLRELRNRLLKAALALVLAMALGFVFFNPIWHVVSHPFCSAVINGKTGCHQAGDQLVVTGVFDPFMLRVKIAFFVGLIISSPVWLYQVWAFIAPGLYRREKRWAYLFVAIAAPLFGTGAALAYVVMSRGLRYLLGLTPSGVLNLPSIDTYLSYFQGMVLGFGLAFELPLALVILNVAHILTHERFRRWRKMMLFGAFLFAGIANPSPDPISMLLLAVPCVVLVEVAEVVIWANDRRRARVPDPYADLADDEVAPLDLDDDPMATAGDHSLR